MALIEFDDVSHAKILVIGVGGGGGNAVNTMISGSLDGVEFVVANTDMQALEANMATHKIQLGSALTPGLVDVSAALDRKLDAIACYASQLGHLFGGEAGMRQAIGSYARRLGSGGGAAERTWLRMP